MHHLKVTEANSTSHFTSSYIETQKLQSLTCQVDIISLMQLVLKSTNQRHVDTYCNNYYNATEAEDNYIVYVKKLTSTRLKD